MKILKNKQIIFGGGVISAFCLVAILAPLITPYPFWQQNLFESLNGPSWNHFFGTDNFGRDVFSRVVYGTRISLISALGAAGIASVVGLTLGLLAGYFGGVIDRLVQTAIDVSWSFPTVLLAILIASVAKPGLGSTLIAIAAVYWSQYARVIRGEVLSVREEEYINAAKGIGCSDFRIMICHVFPNVIPPMIVMVSITMGYAILLEAMLSFLGVGVPPPTPSWGIVLSEGRGFLTRAPWITLFPGAVISLTVLAFNFLGDGLRDYLDPHMQEVR